MGIKESIIRQSDMVQGRKSRRDRKGRGVFYTPPGIVERMTEKLLSDFDPLKNPYARILDPACGTGLFLIKAFEVLKRCFEDNLDAICDRDREFGKRLREEGIASFIVKNNLWGADIDREALDTASDILEELSGRKCRPNLLCCDSLVSGMPGQISLFDGESGEEQAFWSSSYDYIVGNPPYIGHKQVSAKYKKVLQQLYTGIYRDKSDISYCFLKRGIDLLKEGGSLSFISSRYFLEGPSASGLRKYISDNCIVTEIVDFYGSRVFREAGVSACIITLRKGGCGGSTEVLKQRQDIKGIDAELFAPSNFEHFRVDSTELKEEGWVLLSPEKSEIYKAVEKGSSVRLENVADSYQGIITGCDRAFIVSSKEIERYNIEESLLKPWIKNSSIGRNYIKPSGLYLIYSDFIKDEEDYPNAIKYISGFREKLMERRECRKGLRKWYQLQWGRTNEIFDTPKIVYPFKSENSRFLVDREGYYCSADIYCLKLKQQYEGSLTLDYIAAVLNSKLFEFYFKCYAKKISESLYDYYPNTVLRMKIPVPEGESPIMEMADRLSGCRDEAIRNSIICEIDREIYKLYGLSERQIEIVENGLSK